MAEINKVKEKISLYKFFLGIITGIILSILGYIFTNYSSIKTSLLIISLIAIVILIYAFSLLTYLIIKTKGFIMKEILIDIAGILLIVFAIEVIISIKKLSNID